MSCLLWGTVPVTGSLIANKLKSHVQNGEKMNESTLDPERFSFMNDRQQLHIEEATSEEAGRFGLCILNKE